MPKYRLIKGVFHNYYLSLEKSIRNGEMMIAALLFNDL